MNLKRIIENFKSLSLLDFFNLASTRIVNKILFYNSLVGMTLELKDLPNEFLKLPAEFHAKFLTDEECLYYSSNAENDLPLEFVKKALAKGDQCFAMLEANTLASYGWYSQKQTNFTKELDISFNPDWVYMYRGYTLPAYRGKRLHAVGMALALQQYSEQGKKGLISYVETINFSSLKSVYRMGYKAIGNIYIISALNKYFSWTTGNCKQYQLMLKRSA